MRKPFFLLGIFILSTLFSTCTSRSMPGENLGSVKSSLQEVKKEGEDSWGIKWEKLVQAAKKEGSLSLYTSIGTHGRQAIKEGFEDKYGIRVEYTPGRGSDIAEKNSARG